MTPRISRSEFELLVRRASLTLSEQQKTEIHAAYAQIEAIVEALRKPRSRAAEPATIFALDRNAAP